MVSTKGDTLTTWTSFSLTGYASWKKKYQNIASGYQNRYKRKEETKTKPYITLTMRNIDFQDHRLHITAISFVFYKYLWLKVSIGWGHSWEAYSYSIGQEVSSISWNPKVHCCIHKSTALNPILIQLNLVYTLAPYLFKIHFNIILPSKTTFIFLEISRLKFCVIFFSPPPPW
jgi:hypothetical protein